MATAECDEAAEQQRARRIHRQRAVGKASAEPAAEPGDRQVAAQRAQGAARGYRGRQGERGLGHAASPLCRCAALIHASEFCINRVVWPWQTA